MKAIRVEREKEGQPLVWADAPDPAHGPDEVLVDVYATAVNRADLAQRAGHYPPPRGASEILGLDMAGRIAEMGSNVTGWAVDDRVCALLAGGGYAERVAVPRNMLMPIPKGWTFVEGAALPEAYLTAFVNIFMEAGFRPGETVLVHGGASGVGTAAIQLVRAAGGRVFVTAGTDEKTAFCLALGAELAINYRTEDFAARIREHAGETAVDIILDMVGAPYLERNIGLLAAGGRLVFISTLGGAAVHLNIAALMGRRLRLIGSVLRARSPAEKADITQRFVGRFWAQLEDGAVKPVIDAVFPIQEAEAAHRRMRDNLNAGKIALIVRE